MTPSIKKMQRQLDKVPQLTYDYFVSITPKRSGNARNKTTLQNDSIHAAYPYAQRLDKGWSNQAPKGMVKPTEKFWLRLLKRIIRK